MPRSWTCKCGRNLNIRACTKCGQSPPADFVKKKRAANARSYQHTKKKRKDDETYRLQLNKKDRAYQRKWRKKNREKLKATRAKFRLAMGDYRKQFKLKLSTLDGCEGTCTHHGCDIPYDLCDIHHLDPKRKKTDFAKCNCKASHKREVARNTDPDGTIHLKLLCQEHHRQVHAALNPKLNEKQKAAREAVNAYKRGLSKCTHKGCLKEGVLCIPGNEDQFDLDHLFDKGSKVKKAASKVATVGLLVLAGKKDEALAEAKKCRLLHKSCHVVHTLAQFKDKNAWIMNPDNARAFIEEFPDMEEFVRASGVLDEDDEEEGDEEDAEDDEEEDEEDEEEAAQEGQCIVCGAEVWAACESCQNMLCYAHWDAPDSAHGCPALDDPEVQ